MAACNCCSGGLIWFNQAAVAVVAVAVAAGGRYVDAWRRFFGHSAIKLGKLDLSQRGDLSSSKDVHLLAVDLSTTETANQVLASSNLLASN